MDRIIDRNTRKYKKNMMSGGESGIRTHVRVSPKHAFQACAFNHSAISPVWEASPHTLQAAKPQDITQWINSLLSASANAANRGRRGSRRSAHHGRRGRRAHNRR